MRYFHTGRVFTSFVTFLIGQSLVLYTQQHPNWQADLIEKSFLECVVLLLFFMSSSKIED